jgi:pimeloyl-ACP methyl ester carboxylesterase
MLGEAPQLISLGPCDDDGVEPVQIAVSQARLDQILVRVGIYEWHEAPRDGGWRYGTNREFLQKLCEYWQGSFDWRSAEAEMNQFSHHRALIDGNAWHFVHEKGSGPNPQPLLLLHGWPYSFWDFLPMIERLAHPERFGGDVADAFSVVIPSLPGTGFSYKPSSPIGPRSLIEPLHRLMTKVLKYERYMIQGADWGALIAPRLALDHPQSVKGIHLNQIIVRHYGSPVGEGDTGPGPSTAEERAFVKRERDIWMVEDGYFKEQATRPQTLGYAMMDSPVGVAAWILEKFFMWTDIPQGGDLEDIFTRDQLLTEIMIYLVTRTFNTAAWFYAGIRDEGAQTLPQGTRVGFLAFRNEPLSPPPPRSFAERAYNIVHWSESRVGGHFAALQVPDRLINDVRAFRRRLDGRRLA